MKDQSDCVLNVLEELGDKQLFLNHQCSTSISFLLLLLSIVRPMRNLWELILKKFLDLPELNRSILFSLNVL